MTTETDVSARTSGQRPTKAGKKPARSSEPPAIQINMPKQGARRPPSRKPGAQTTSMESIEGLLGKLMGRLDESDQRYSNALDDLNQRLNELSQRAHSARGTHSDNANDALDRVRAQASSLAAQVNEAGTTHRAQHGAPLPGLERNMGEFTSANDDSLNPNFGDSRLNDDFADVTQRLERSLAARAPASDFDTLSHRMEDLARRFDAALATKNDLAALHAIESQLNALTAGFAEARQNYARVEAIEGNLASLMNWAQSTGSPGHGGDERLDAIEQALYALNDNAREMDDRTVGTLQAMNEALHALAANVGPGDGDHEHDENAALEDIGRETPPHAAAARPGPEDYAEVWIDEQPEPDHAPHGPTGQAAPTADRLGATIPDYHPAPRKSVGGGAPQRQERVEPKFEAENDFIASARRAAAAAAQAPAPRPAKSSSRSNDPAAVMAGSTRPSRSRRSQPVLVIAAVGLLLVSAGLLFARLNAPSRAPVTGGSQNFTPKAPALAPNPTPGKDAAPVAPAQKTPAAPKTPPAPKQHSQRMMNGSATPPKAPAMRTSRKDAAPAPVKASAIVQSGAPISTTTLLASLPPDTGQQQIPGVTTAIKEPATRAPAPRASTAPRTAAPALVPSTQSGMQQTPIPLPKRAPARPPVLRPTPANTSPVDSARANEVPRKEHGLQTKMPPARIGPHSLRMAAARGNPAAQVEIASRYAKGTGVPKNLKQSAEWHARAAAQGFAPGQYRLAALYERGQGVKKDVGKARTWYRRAAELGNVRAMHNLAVLSTRADGRDPDYTTAKNWFHEAARHGLADSQFNMGILYESGLGVKKNAAEAYKWFALAARQGDTGARKRLDKLRPTLPARSLSVIEKHIQQWRPATVKAAANSSGPPRGGWSNANIKTNPNTADPGLIAKAQFLLNKLGFDAGMADGKLGPQTVAAIRRFEGRTGVAQTGKVTPALLRRLEALSG